MIMSNKSRVKIVILQRSFLNEKHISELKKYALIRQYSAVSSLKKAKAGLIDATIAVVDSYTLPVNDDLIKDSPYLKYICLLSTGHDNVDMAAIRKRGIKISNIPDYATTAVAEHVFALLLGITHNIPKFDNLMRKKPYILDQTDGTQNQFLGANLKNKKIGIIGLGRIGRSVLKIAKGFGMQCIGYDPFLKKVPGVNMVNLNRLLAESDVITLHAPLSLKKAKILSKQKVNLIKKGSIFINTARSKLIDEKALYEALKTGRIRAAGLDVLDYKAILKLKNVVATPHSAWFTKEACEKLGDTITQNIVGFLSGKPKNQI